MPTPRRWSTGSSRLDAAAAATLQSQVPQWELVLGHHLRRIFGFKDFRTALAFVNRVGEVAEREGHHPNLSLAWGRVEVEIWTHKVDGLTEADFVLAAKLDELPRD